MSDAKPRARHKARTRPSPQSSSTPQPRLKLVIRRLPPTLPEEIFKQTIQAWEKAYDWLSYIPGKAASSKSKSDRHGRAYLLFRKNEDLQDFWRKYNGHTFVSSAEVEYKALVEFAPYQKVPRSSPSKFKDALNGTLEQDPEFLAFVELLNAPVEPLKPEVTTPNKITPLIEHLRVQRAKQDAKAKARKEKTAAAKAKAQEEKREAAQELADATSAKIAAAKSKNGKTAPVASTPAITTTKKGKGKTKPVESSASSESGSVDSKSIGDKRITTNTKARGTKKPETDKSSGRVEKVVKAQPKKSKKPDKPAGHKKNTLSDTVVDISGPTPAEMAAAKRTKT